ncbi:hypothetical protein TNCV_37961 [Trichonephila clavipes]|nr:hypothetical protein TNCV_37961 [Trichonephila clavipes]
MYRESPVRKKWFRLSCRSFGSNEVGGAVVFRSGSGQMKPSKKFEGVNINCSRNVCSKRGFRSFGVVNPLLYTREPVGGEKEISEVILYVCCDHIIGEES